MAGKHGAGRLTRIDTTIQAAIRSGYHVFDTSDIYGNARSRS